MKDPPALGKAATTSLLKRYMKAEHWVQKAVILLSLNQYWAPVGSDMVLDALQQKDARLRALGLEALLRSEEDLLPKVVSAELLEELIKRQLNEKNPHFKKRLQLALERVVPQAEASSKSEWIKWWQGAKESWQPQPWQPKPSDDEPGERRSVASMADRAFNLYDKGLDLAICIDSTGSMQSTIDLVAGAIGQMVDILQGLSPKFRLALVHYKDAGNMGKISGAVISPLNKNIKSVRKKLIKLIASGGNASIDESVLDGLQLTLDPKLKWKKDSNKLVILIGDAPSHFDNQDKINELVKEAYEKPGKLFSRGTTGPLPDATPFITSAMGVVMEYHPGYLKRMRKNPRFNEAWEEWQAMRKQFAHIANIGGGVYSEITFKVRMRPREELSKKEMKKFMEDIRFS